MGEVEEVVEGGGGEHCGEEKERKIDFKCFDEEALAASKSANPPISTCVYSPSSS